MQGRHCGVTGEEAAITHRLTCDGNEQYCSVLLCKQCAAFSFLYYQPCKLHTPGRSQSVRSVQHKKLLPRLLRPRTLHPNFR